MSELTDRIKKILAASRANQEEALISGEIPLDKYQYTLGVLKGYSLSEDALLEALKDPDRD